MTSSCGTREPPKTFVGRLKYLGPGMIVAAGLVGSGELIATTKVGAQAGLSLAWLILLGCVVKVFVQIELGRYAVSTGETTLKAINRVPGPRYRVNWILWAWLLMMVSTYGMLGGIIGGVGQALSLALPLSGDYQDFVAGSAAFGNTYDDKLWAALIAIGTSLILFFGRYRTLEAICIAMVFCFTLVTVGNVVALQTTSYAFPAEDIVRSFWFQNPASSAAWLTAIAAFGIIGISATDMIVYPYWCIEKGYFKFIGAKSNGGDWARRARGWLGVMRTDALFSLLVYTLVTLAFYFIGAAVLHRDGSDPDGMRMVSTLATAYVPVFGEYARLLFLSGAFAVLYSSFLVSIAGSARLFADFMHVSGFISGEVKTDQVVVWLSLLLPLVCLLIFLTGFNPVKLIVFGGLVQSFVLPAIGFCALFFRFRLVDESLRPGRLWDSALILSCISFLLIGGFGLVRTR